jgi:predicted transcriptional regulator
MPKLASRSPADALFDAVQNILSAELSKPLSETEVAELLAVSKAQAKAWLKELLKRGVIEKLAKPVRYRVISTAVLL